MGTRTDVEEQVRIGNIPNLHVGMKICPQGCHAVYTITSIKKNIIKAKKDGTGHATRFHMNVHALVVN